MEPGDRIDELLQKPCYIIDFLPEQVAPCAGGQFFDVERHLLNSKKYFSLTDRFENVILKLMCYSRVSIQWNGWMEHPSPQVIEDAFNTIMDNHAGWLNILLPEENTLVVFEWGSLNLSVYNPSEKVQPLLQKLAVSEGLFWRKSAGNQS